MSLRSDTMYLSSSCSSQKMGKIFFLRYFGIAVLSLGIMAKSYAEESLQPQSSTDFHARITGATISGKTFVGNKGTINYKEYHSPDGRVFGYNGSVKNSLSCWKIVAKDTICYYYGAFEDNAPCWKIHFVDIKTVTGVLTTSASVTMEAQIEKGNPDNLIDYGVKWNCGAQVVAQNID